MSALLASRFEQLRLQPAALEHDVSARWTSSVHNYSKRTLSTADQIFKDAGLRVRIATESDRPAILNFLRQFFFKDEPLNIAIKLLTSGHGDYCEDLENFCMSSLSDNMSIICESVDSSVEGVAAVGLCGIIDRSKEEKIAEALAQKAALEPLPETAGPEERFERIDTLLDTVTAGADIFGRIPNLDRLLDIKILSVHPHYRGKRVAIGICDKIRDIAIEKGIDILRVCCSSHYSALAVSRLGYECVHRLAYSDFLDSKGNRIFNTEPPHNTMATYILNLRNKT